MIKSIYLFDEPNIHLGSHFLTVLRSTAHAFLHIDKIDFFVVTNRKFNSEYLTNLPNCDACNPVKLDQNITFTIFNYNQVSQHDYSREYNYFFFLSSISSHNLLNYNISFSKSNKYLFILGTSPIFRISDDDHISETELAHREFALNELKKIQQFQNKIAGINHIEVWDWDSGKKNELAEFPGISFGYLPEFHEFESIKKSQMREGKLKIGMVGTISEDRGFYDFINLAKLNPDYRFIMHGRFSDSVICRKKRFSLFVLNLTKQIGFINLMLKKYLCFILRMRLFFRGIYNLELQNNFIISNSDLQLKILELDYIYLASNKLMHPSGIQKYAIGSGVPQILVDSASETVTLAKKCNSGIFLDYRDLENPYRLTKVLEESKVKFEPRRLVELSKVTDSLREWVEK
jgi:glycosyltransferase involved in cell wall biosynthesis